MNNSPIYDRIASFLDSRRQHDRFRSLAQPTPPGAAAGIDLSTNSYLALHANASVAAEARSLAGGMLHGNLASRLIAETSPLYRLLEQEIAEWKKTESALIFNSGYAANVGILQALCSRDTELFSDRLNHASIIDGARLAGCKLNRYAHNDMSDLRNRLIASTSREKLVVCDTVFSMDGDRAPLGDICDLAQHAGALVMVDEAHAAGILGKTNASGAVEEAGVESYVAVRMGTLSKAVAGMGGFFAGSNLIRDYLVNAARSLIYSTALPHSILAFDLAAIRHIRAHPRSGAALLGCADHFRDQLHERGFSTMQSSTQILPCLTKNDAEALRLSQFLASRAIRAPAIRPPTVPAGTARIRFSLHAGCSHSDLQCVFAALDEWRRLHG